jgi:predicted lipid-binding transport protein (Tim44 family)
MPVDLILYIVIAAVMIVWLRNTLGTKHGSETDRSEIINQLKERQQAQQDQNTGKVINLPGFDRPQDSEPEAMDTRKLIATLAIEGGDDTAQEIISFMRRYPEFDPKQFVGGARDAFPLIVEAFAKSDLRTLKALLSPPVFSAFEQEIEDRKNRGETLTTDVHAVKDCLIQGIKTIGNMAYIKLRFIADETIVIHDSRGQILSGNPDKLVTMNDVWTFGRDMNSNDPTWYLFETSDDVPDEFKNPVPDSK